MRVLLKSRPLLRQFLSWRKVNMTKEMKKWKFLMCPKCEKKTWAIQTGPIKANCDICESEISLIKKPIAKKSKTKKEVRETDEAYLSWIRSLHCSVSTCNNMDIDPHHTVRKSQLGSDYSCVPLCREHHSSVHNLGVHSFDKKFSVNLKDIASKLKMVYDARN